MGKKIAAARFSLQMKPRDGKDGKDGKDGQNGADGESTVFVDLDNEMDAVPVDESAKVLETTTITTHARLWKGPELMTASNGISATSVGQLAGVTPQTSFASGVLTARWTLAKNKRLTALRYTATVNFTYNLQNFSATFTMATVRGKAVYQLAPSTDCLRFSRNGHALTPASLVLTCGHRTVADGAETTYMPGTTTKEPNGSKSAANGIICQVGASAEGASDGYNIFFRCKNSNGNYTSWNWLSNASYEGKDGTVYNAMDIPSSTAYTAVEFILSAANRVAQIDTAAVIDRETIPIIKDGVDGADGKDGIDGQDGIDGKDGKDGQDGSDGVTYQITARPTSISLKATDTANRSVAIALAFFQYSGTARQAFSCYWALFAISPDTNGTAYTYTRLDGGGKVTSATTSPVLSYGSSYTALTVRIGTAAISDDSSAYLTEFLIPIVRDGQQGEKGKISRNYYYLGEWSELLAQGKTFAANDYETPFVSDNDTYYLFIGDNGAYTCSTGTANGGSGNITDVSRWATRISTMSFLMSQVVFTHFAKLGQAVFNEDWMYSAYGTGMRTVWTGTYYCSDTSVHQVGNSTANNYNDAYNHFAVAAGRRYTVTVKAAAKAGAAMRCRIYYNNWKYGVANVLMASEQEKTYTLEFVAEYSGVACVAVSGSGTPVSGRYGTVSVIAALSADDTEYQKMSPSFVGDNTLTLFEATDNNGGISVRNRDNSGTAKYYNLAKACYIGYAPVHVVAGKSYRVTLRANIVAGYAGTLCLCMVQGGTKTKASNQVLAISSTTRKDYSATFNVISSYSGEVRFVAFINAAGNETASAPSATDAVRMAYVFGLAVTAVDPFIPRVAIDWRTGYAHFAGGNAGFRPDGSLFLRSGYLGGFLRNMPFVIDGSNIDGVVTTANAWIYYGSLGAAAHSTFGAGDLPTDVRADAPTPVVDLNRTGATMVFKTNPGEAVIHLPFITKVWQGDAYNDFSEVIGDTDLTRRELARARSYVGASVEIYNVSGEEMYVVGVYNGYVDGGTNGYAPMSTDADCQNALSRIHTLPDGAMVRMTCRRLAQYNMLDASTGGGQEIIYWDVEAGALGYTAADFDSEDYGVL